MAISDLLWMCPECGRDRGLVADADGYRCDACGTTYRRGRGATIIARTPDGSEKARRPVEWLEQMDAPETLVPHLFTPDTPIRRARVELARVVGSDTVQGETGYLNRFEIWGEESSGTLEVRADALVYTQDGPGPDGGPDPEVWPLETLTAVQASSHTLQLNRREAPLVSFRFLDDSVYLWEELLHAVLRAFYQHTGRGEIVEFQPRIVTE